MRYLSIIIFFFFTFVSVRAETLPADSVVITYKGGAMNQVKGSDELTQMGAGIELPQSMVGMYAGNQITSIRMYLGEAEIIDSLKVFVQNKEGKLLDIKKASSIKQKAWNQVNLSAPVSLTGDSLFIGYYIWTKGYPIKMKEMGINSKWADWVYKNGKWEHSNSGYQTNVHAIEVVVKGDALPFYNATILKMELPAYVQVGKLYPVQTDVQNSGLKVITELDFVCTAQSKSITYQLTGLNIRPGEHKVVDFSDFALTEEGDYNVTVAVSKVNGHDDYDLSDNGRTFPITCRNQFLPRKILVENFTSEKCTNCPDAHKQLESACEGFENIVSLEHHAGFMDDIYTISESWGLYSYYSPIYKFNPALMIDRTNITRYGADSGYGMDCPLVNMSSAEAMRGWMQRCMDIPSKVSLKLKVGYESETRNVTIDLEGEKLLPLLTDSAYVHLWITEDSLYNVMQSTKDEKLYHRHTARQQLTPIFGEGVKMNEPFRKSYSVSIPEKWNEKKIHIVAFVSAYNSKSNNNSVVYNSETASLPGTSSGIQEVNANIKVYINPSSELCVEGDFDYYDVYLQNGTCVGKSLNKNLKLAEGAHELLLVRVVQKSKVSMYKLLR